MRLLKTTRGKAQCLAYGPDGRSLFTGHSENKLATLRRWDLGTGESEAVPGADPAGVFAVAVSPDGRWLGACDRNGVKVWPLVSGAPGGEPKILGQLAVPMGVRLAFSPDGRLLTAIWGYQEPATVWDVSSGREWGWPLDADDWATALAFGRGRRVALGANPHVELFDYRIVGNEMDLEPVGIALTHRGEVKAAAFSTDGRRLVTASGLTLWVWDAESGECVHKFKASEHRVDKLALSRDGRLALSAGDGTTVRLFAVDSGRELARLALGIGEIQGVAIAPDGLTGAAVGSTCRTAVFDIDTG